MVIGDRVHRRTFLLFGAGAALAPRSVLVSRSFAARRIPRIGFLAPGSRDADQRLVDALRAGLAELGWADNDDVVILDRWGEGQADRLPAIAAELVNSGIDVLVTAGTPATLAARAATATVPIVLVGVANPIASGAVDSRERPDGNATGLSLDSAELVATRLRLLQALVPDLRRVAVILRHDPGLDRNLLEIRTCADRIGVQVVALVVTTGQTLERAFLWLRGDSCNAIYLASGPLGPAKRAEMITLAAASRLPALFPFRVFTAAGGLMSLAPDDADLFRRAAGYVDKLLNGAKPADLPVEQPTKFDLVINLKTARALGLTVPPLLLAQADDVIE